MRALAPGFFILMLGFQPLQLASPDAAFPQTLADEVDYSYHRASFAVSAYTYLTLR